MFGMITPIDAISYGLKAGMVFGRAQTIWATRLMEMQGFWMGFPAAVSDLPKVTPSGAAEPLPVVTELHVEAMAVTPVATEAIVGKPARPKATPVVKKAKPRTRSVIQPPAPETIVSAPLAEAPLPVTSPDPAPVAMPPEPALSAEPAIEQSAASVPEPMAEVPGEVMPKTSAPKAAPVSTGAAESIALPATAVPADAQAPMDLALKPIPRRAPPKAKAAPKPPFAE